MKKKVFCFLCTTALVTLLFSSVVWASGNLKHKDLDYPSQVVKGEDFVLTIGTIELTPMLEGVDLSNYTYIMKYSIDYQYNNDHYFQNDSLIYKDFPLKFRVNTTNMKLGGHTLEFYIKGNLNEKLNNHPNILISDPEPISFEVVEAPATPAQNPNTGANTVWFSAASLLFACSALGIFHIRKLEVR